MPDTNNKLYLDSVLLDTVLYSIQSPAPAVTVASSMFRMRHLDSLWPFPNKAPQ